ncbi:MAG: glucose 1-dehydrogenase [Salinimicrobium sp.]
MKAISLIPGTTDISLIDVEEPKMNNSKAVKLKVRQVGICGTDREEASGGRADAPLGKKRLVVGHEMFGEVVEVGDEVKNVKKGDFGLFTVRRGCGKCDACLNGRSDMCYTGDYKERGIKELDGFQSQFVVDLEENFIKVPEDIKDIGVLTEPMSVAAKAIDEALKVQKERLQEFDDVSKWLHGKKVLVAGIGAIGLLAAFALRLRGAEVYGLDVVDEDSLRPQILKEIGGVYIDGRDVQVTNIDIKIGEMDFIFEAAGIAKLQFELIDALGINGIYVATGIPGGNRPVSINGPDLMRQIVLKNQIILGSVNAGPQHFDMAVSDLARSKEKWPEVIKKLITQRLSAEDFRLALGHSVDGIKVVVDWENSEI